MHWFLITTQHNKGARHDYIRKHLRQAMINYRTVMAPDYRALNMADPFKAKHTSLTLAYYHIAQTALFEGIQEYVVMEDDINFKPNFFPIYRAICNSLPTDWHFCYLTKTEHNKEAGKTIPVNDHVCRVLSNWWETPITLWRSSFAEYFEHVISEKLNTGSNLGHIDHELVKICQQGFLNFYASETNIANGLSTARGLEEAQSISMDGALSNG